jgi:hypothetical protein
MTEEEFDRLRDASEGQGSRSVSEFARNALMTSSQPAPAAASGASLEALDERITKVEQDVGQVKDELSRHINGQRDPKTKT